MAKRLEKTQRKGIFVTYSKQNKKNRTVITAQLVDEHGVKIEDCKASHTQRGHDTEEDARIAARNKALKKFDEKFSKFHISQTDDSANFFTKAWLEIDEDKRINLAPETRENKNSKRTAIIYFEKNVIPLLDNYGPLISPDEALRICESLYTKMLLNKKYTHSYAGKDAVMTIPHFIATAKVFLATDKRVKSTLGMFPQTEHMELLMEIVQSRVLGEDRLRSLLEAALRREENLEEFVAERFWDKVEADGHLITVLKKLKSEEERAAAADKIIFLLREFSGDENQTKAQTNVHIRDANEILSNLSAASQRVMPVVVLPEFIVAQIPQIEACKELPWKVRTRFAAICFFIAGDDPHAVGGIMMMTSGPRVSEVCAIQYGDVLDLGYGGVCVINYTVDGDMRREDGKNIYFHRPIFFPRFAMDALRKRKSKLLEMGYTEEQLKSAYIIHRADDLFCPENPHTFSAKIKKLLKLAGCVDEYWDSVRYAMTVQPDYDYFRRPELFDIAYGLRRDATTMLCNVARMAPTKVDAILGHRLQRHAENWTDKITRDDEWPIIIAEQERIVYDPEHSNHPLFAVQKLSVGETIHTPIPYQGMAITSESYAQVEATIKTNGNDDVRFKIPIDAKFETSIECVTNTTGPHPWLGTLHSKEEYDRVKAQAIQDYMKEVKRE